MIRHRLRIRNASNTADVLAVSSLPGDAYPYLVQAPSGDGTEFDPFTGESRAGEYVYRVADPIVAGTDRLVTSQLEDAGFRDQLLERLAYGEYSLDEGATWSVEVACYVTRLQAIDAITWEIAISDPARREKGVTVFAPRESVVRVSGAASIGATAILVEPLSLAIVSGTVLTFGTQAVTVTAPAAIGATSVSVAALTAALSVGDGASYAEGLADFIARWPNRGCIAGGPVRGGFGPQADRGGYEMQIAERRGTGVWVKFVAGYASPTFARTTRTRDCADRVNAAAANFWRNYSDGAATGQLTTFTQVDASFWPGLILEVVGTGFYSPTTANDYPELSEAGDRWREIMRGDGAKQGFFVHDAGLTVGSAVRVRLLAARPCEASPIYWDGHPLDLLDQLWTEAGVPHDATAAAWTTLRGQLGDDLRLALRITDAQELASFLQNVVYGPFGVGVRQTATGLLEPFATRIFANTPPTDTIDETRVGEGTTTPFRLDKGTAIRRVVVEQTRLVLATTADQSPSPDGFSTQSERVERTNGDASATGSGELTFAIPGMVHTAGSWQSVLAPRADAMAAEVFDRAGRGLREGETFVVRGRGLDALLLGQEVLVDLPQLPNHNKRLGDDPSVAARAMQIVRITPEPNGWAVKLADSGPNAQPVATVPTLALAASVANPRTVAEVTITNAAALNAAGLAVRLQMASAAGAPAATAYTDLAYYAPGTVPTGAIALPPVTAGRTVGVRARSEQTGKRPSNYSTPATLALVVIDAPTGVTATPDGSDASRCVLAWTVGPNAGADVTDVFLRLATELSSQAVRRDVLEAGSTGATLEDLVPGTNYVAAVQHRDPGSGDTSALVEVSFTAGASTPTPIAPEDPFPFAGQQQAAFGLPKRDGLYGLAVAATVFPSSIEFLEAVETSAGSGSYGPAASVGMVPAVQGDWTLYQATAPNDGLARQLTARTVASNGTSATTDPVEVVPWEPIPLLPYATASGVRALRNFRRVAENATTRTWGWVRGALVSRVWVYVRELPIFDTTSNPYPNPDDPTDSLAPDQVLAAGTGTLAVPKPSAGMRSYVQVEARDADLRVTWMRRLVLEPTGALAVTVTPSEVPGTGTLTVIVTDPAGVLAAVNPVQFRRTIDQTTDEVAPSSTTGSTYARSEPLQAKHVVRLEPILNYADGTQQTLAAYTFDADRIADVIAGPTVSYSGSTATVAARYDTDATAGAAQAFYRYDGGAWTPIAVASDLTISIAVAADINTTHLVEFYALNPDGSAGPVTAVTIDKLGLVEGVVSLTGVIPTRVDATHFTVDCTRTGFPSGTTFDIDWSVDGLESGNSDGHADGDFPVTITTSGSMSATPSGKVAVRANVSGQLVAAKSKNGFFAT